jgi:hypothetical protein
MFLRTANRPKLEAIFGSYMRTPLCYSPFAALLIGTHAHDLPVMKDSEAVQYVGRNIEVRGFVVSVTCVL